MQTTIHCPKCKHEFQPEAALQHQLKHLISEKEVELQKEYLEKENKLRAYQAKLTKEKFELENTVTKMLMDKEKQLIVELKEKVKKEYQVEISELNKELQEKQKIVNEVKTKEVELAKLQRKFEEQEKEFELKYEQSLTSERKRMEEIISCREQQKHDMRYAEKEKQLHDLKKHWRR